MRIVGITEAAKEMGFCRRHTSRRVRALQDRNPDVVILLPRENEAERFKLRIDMDGLRLAVRREQGHREADTMARLARLEAESVRASRKTHRLEIRLERLENKASASG